VSIEIYDLAGKKVDSLLKGFQKAGSHSVKWNGTNFSRNPVCPGAYLCHWEVREELQFLSENKKILFLKNR